MTYNQLKCGMFVIVRMGANASFKGSISSLRAENQAVSDDIHA